MSAIEEIPVRRQVGPRGGPLVRGMLDRLRRHRSFTIILGMVIVTAALPLVVLVPPFDTFAQNTWIDGFAIAGIYVLLALGLNIVVGVAGLLDLGYAAFFAIGAYTYAFAASPFGHQQFGLPTVPFWIMLLVGAFVAALFGIMLGAPTLRLRGDYLAIVTLGFGEIVPITFRNLNDQTGGPNGIGGIYRPELPGIEFSAITPMSYYVTMAVIVTLTMIIVYRLQDSRVGRAWMALREDELAAASNGVNTVTTKLLAFALGASVAGLAGVFNAARFSIAAPDEFVFSVSFTVLAMVVLGGMGNAWGVAVGAFIIYTIQSVLLKQLNGFFRSSGVPILKDIDFVQYQFLLYGLALVAMMLIRPEGLFPNRRRQRELRSGRGHEGPDEALETAPGVETEHP